MEIDVIRTRSNRPAVRGRGAVDVSNVPTTQLREVAADQNVYLERRGGRTYLVPA